MAVFVDYQLQSICLSPLSLMLPRVVATMAHSHGLKLTQVHAHCPPPSPSSVLLGARITARKYPHQSTACLAALSSAACAATLVTPVPVVPLATSPSRHFLLASQ